MKWLSALRIRFATKLFFSHLLAVFLVSGSVGTFFYLRAMDNLMRSIKSRLMNSAALLSQSIDARLLDLIRGPEDVQLEIYQTTLDALRRMRRTNPDIAFLYIMRREGDRVVFVVDSDETSRQALPGREYTEVNALMEQGFNIASVDDDLYADEWGVFLSGYAPLLNGEGRYLLGIDMRADEVSHKLAEMRLTGLLSLVASVLLALLFALYLSRGLGLRLATLSRQCRDLMAGRYDARITGRTYDEFDDLADTFNAMSESLQKTRLELDRTVQRLEESQRELERRVEERTKELQEALQNVNLLKGLLPICSSCKKIRDDQGYWKQVEQFVTEQTGAKFTHGICPECAAKMYRDLFRGSGEAPPAPPPAA